VKRTIVPQSRHDCIIRKRADLGFSLTLISVMVLVENLWVFRVPIFASYVELAVDVISFFRPFQVK
jgi:hypothetical protein